VIELVRDPVEGDRIERLPRWWVASDPDRYCHIPQSAYVERGKYREPGRRKMVLSLLCGQIRFPASREGMFMDRVPPGRLRCGTCLGRHLGIAIESVEFRPRDCFETPTYCPAFPDRSPCSFCGARVRFHWAGGQSLHRAGPLLSRWKPCDMHGWRFAWFRSDAIYCGAWSGGRGRYCNRRFRRYRKGTDE